VRQEHLVYIEAAPDWLQDPVPASAPQFPTDWKPLSATGRVSLRLDLTRTPDELLAQFRKNTRYEVRRAERANLTVGSATGAGDIDEFLKLYLHLAGRKRFAADSPEHVRGILRWIVAEPSRGVLLLARDGAAAAQQKRHSCLPCLLYLHSDFVFLQKRAAAIRTALFAR